MKYTWRYGIFHWIVHYLLAIAFVWISDLHLVNIIIPINVGGYVLRANVVDHFLFIVITSLIDLDHLVVYRTFGKKGIFAFARKRITYPIHNFFVFGLFAATSAFTAIMGLKVLAIFLFAPILHMAWDIFEDTFIFKASYKKWEKTWGLKKKEIEQMWRDMQKNPKQKGLYLE